MNAELAALTSKLASGLVTDEAYQISQREYEQEKSRLNQEIKRLDQERGDFEAQVKELFQFATQAPADFRNGDSAAKRGILSKLGSNLRQQDRKLHVELHPCFRALQELPKPHPGENARFETDHTRKKTGRTEGCGPNHPIWSRVWDEVRIFLLCETGEISPLLNDEDFLFKTFNGPHSPP